MYPSPLNLISIHFSWYIQALYWNVDRALGDSLPIMLYKQFRWLKNLVTEKKKQKKKTFLKYKTAQKIILQFIANLQYHRNKNLIEINRYSKISMKLTDRSFTLADSNSFLNTWEILPHMSRKQIFRKIFLFYHENYVVHTHKAILISTLNTPLF